MMRRFKGQKLSKENDFFVQDYSSFNHISPTSSSNITLGDIPKDELLATAAVLNEKTFEQLGLRRHTFKRIPGRRTVSSINQAPPPPIPSLPTAARVSSASQLPTLNQRIMSAAPVLPVPEPIKASTQRNPNEEQASSVRKDTMTLDPKIRNQQPKEEEETTYNQPARIKTHRNKLNMDLDFHYGDSPPTGKVFQHKSTDSLISEIIDTYTDFELFVTPQSSTKVPELVDCPSASSFSIDTDSASQFSFDIAIDDNEIISRQAKLPARKISAASNKPLPPIPVKKVSQHKFRDYDASKEKYIPLKKNTTIRRTESHESSPSLYTSNDNHSSYMLTRTGEDDVKMRLLPAVSQDENDVEKFTRKCSSSSSRYSSSSGEDSLMTAPSSPIKGSINRGEHTKSEYQSPPSSPEVSIYKRNPYSPKAFKKRNLTPINENNGYQPGKSKLVVIND